jgi:hypothetical protein
MLPVLSARRIGLLHRNAAPWATAVVGQFRASLLRQVIVSLPFDQTQASLLRQVIVSFPFDH